MSVKMAINLLEKLDKKTDDHGQRLARIEQKITDQNGNVLKNTKNIDRLNKTMWTGLGAITAIGIMLKIIGML